MNALTRLLSISESRLDLRVFEDRAISTSTVNLDKVLINDASCTNIKVTYLRVAHLSVRQTDILSRSLELRVWIISVEIIHVRGWSLEDDITLTLVTDSPSIENHQKSFFCHNEIYI